MDGTKNIKNVIALLQISHELPLNDELHLI
jgi:hypothetical protein